MNQRLINAVGVGVLALTTACGSSAAKSTPDDDAQRILSEFKVKLKDNRTVTCIGVLGAGPVLDCDWANAR